MHLRQWDLKPGATDSPGMFNQYPGMEPEWNPFPSVSHQAPGRAGDGEGSAREGAGAGGDSDGRLADVMLSMRKQRPFNDSGTLPHSRLSPLQVYEVWKSIWPGLEVPPLTPPLTTSPPEPESPVNCASWAEAFAHPRRLILPCWQLPATPATPPPVHEQLWPIDRGGCVDSPGRCIGNIVVFLFVCFFLFSVRKRWKRFSPGKKTLSILVNVKGPLCLHWYFTSEPFRRAEPSADAPRWHRQKTAGVSPSLQRRCSN